MITTVTRTRFLTIFRGKQGSYLENHFPKEKPSEKKKIKTEIYIKEGKIDDTLVQKHFAGEFALGVCPVDERGQCYFGVIDIDYYGNKISKVLDFISLYNIPLVPFVSKSGGLHLYCFFSKSTQARKVRAVLFSLIEMLSLENLYGKGKVEIFPKQDAAANSGSMITLPYFMGNNTYTPMLKGRQELSLEEALLYIQKSITNIEAFENCIQELPYSDAPPCMQKILLANLVGDEDTGRNNFLFSYAVYAQKKWESDYRQKIIAMNNSFSCPIEESQVTSLISSIEKTDYMYRCKDIPLCTYCDKAKCKTREFGIGKQKGHFTGIEYGTMYRYKAQEPYYVWKLRLQGQENWTDVIFKDEGLLLDQRNFAKMCIRYLNTAPVKISDNAWYNVLNLVLPNIEDIEVAKTSDTSGLAILKNAFIKYLSNKQSRRDSPYQIRVGLCYRRENEDGAKYYFTNTGFIEYLKAN